MKVMCINSKDAHLTLGKIYCVSYISKHVNPMYKLVDDLGYNMYYGTKRFIKLSECTLQYYQEFMYLIC
jgi:hypothetical protein